MNKMNIIYCILVLLLNISPIFNEIIEYDLDDDYLELDLKCSNTYRFYLQISNNLVGEIVFTIKSSYKLDKNYIDVYEYSSRTNEIYIHNSTALFYLYPDTLENYKFWKASYIPKEKSTKYIVFEFKPDLDIDFVLINVVKDYIQTEKTGTNNNFLALYDFLATKIYKIYFNVEAGQIANIEISFPKNNNDFDNFEISNIYEYSSFSTNVYNSKQNFQFNKTETDPKIILESSYYIYYSSTKYIALELKLSHDIISNYYTSFSVNIDKNSNNEKLIKSYDYILDYGETTKISHMTPYDIIYFCLLFKNSIVNFKITINSYKISSNIEENLENFIHIYVYECKENSQSYCNRGRKYSNLEEIFSKDKQSFSYELSYSARYSSTKYLFFEVQSSFDFYNFEFYVYSDSKIFLIIILILLIIIILIVIFFVYRCCRKKNSSKTNSNQILSDIKEIPL